MQIDSLALPYGRIYLAFNDDAVKRSALTVAASGDGGMTWQRLLVLESDPAGSFSYPTLQYLPDEVHAQSTCSSCPNGAGRI